MARGSGISIWEGKQNLSLQAIEIEELAGTGAWSKELAGTGAWSRSGSSIVG